MPLDLASLIMQGVGVQPSAAKDYKSIESQTGRVGAQLGRQFQIAGQQAIPTGLGMALDLLLSRGATDPRLMNLQLGDIEAQRKQQQIEAQQNIAQSGLAGSPLGALLGQAINQSAGRSRQQLFAQEAQTQAERFRSDLQNIFGGLFLNPQIQLASLYQPNQKKKSGGLGSLLGAAGGILGGIYGGGLPGAQVGSSIGSSLGAGLG